MARWCRIFVLVVLGFYALAGGTIPSPLAATGTNCITTSSGSDGCPSGCDGTCPPAMCIVAAYAVPAGSPIMTARTLRYVAYASAPAERLTAHTPDPNFRPPNA